MQEKEYILNIKGPLHPPKLLLIEAITVSNYSCAFQNMCVCCSFIKKKKQKSTETIFMLFPKSILLSSHQGYHYHEFYIYLACFPF